MNNEDKTITKTLWSETLIEGLCADLKKDKPDPRIVDALRELKAKGFAARYITSKVRKEVGSEAATRVKNLMKKI